MQRNEHHESSLPGESSQLWRRCRFRVCPFGTPATDARLVATGVTVVTTSGGCARTSWPQLRDRPVSLTGETTLNLPNHTGLENRGRSTEDVDDVAAGGFFGWLGHHLVEGVKALASGFDKAEKAFNSLRRRPHRLER
jgi:hypothetical protein